MNQRTLELALKKQRVQLRSAALRDEFSGYVQGLNPITSGIDKGIAGAAWLRQHPQWLAAASFGFFILRPRRAIKLGMRIWGLRRLLGRLAPFLHQA